VSLQKPKPRGVFELPHDLAGERAVLGFACLRPAVTDQICRLLRQESFFRRAHQEIFVAIESLHDRGLVVDFVTLSSELAQRKRLEDVGGPSYLANLIESSRPIVANVAHYCRILRDLELRRALVQDAERTLDLIAEGEHDGSKLLEDADLRMAALQGDQGGARARWLPETSTDRFRRLEWRTEHPGELRGLDTGYPSINELTLGWAPGDLIIVAAKTSIGKTTFAVNTAVHAASLGKRVAVFSLEMRFEQLEDRMLSQLSGVPLSRIQSGHHGSQEAPQIASALETMHSLRIGIVDRSGQTARDVRSECRRMHADGGLDLAVVDYMQLMPSALVRKGARRDEELTDTALRLKSLGGELGVPVIAVSQVKRGDGRPSLDWLKESGSLEQFADVVAILHRKDHRVSGPTEFILGKQRNGPTGTVILHIDRDTQTFTDGGQQEPEAQAEAAAEDEKQTKQRKRAGYFARRAGA
jgi:replicative DNA helicase